MFVGIKIKTPMGAVADNLLELSKGDLNVDNSNVHSVMRETLSIKDAQGELAKNMKMTIGATTEASKELESDARILQEMSENCTNNVSELSRSIEDLASGAVSMAEDVEHAATQVNVVSEGLNKSVSVWNL